MNQFPKVSKNHLRKFLPIALSLCTVFFSGCQGTDATPTASAATSGGGGSTSSTGTNIGGGATITPPVAGLFMKVATRWDSDVGTSSNSYIDADPTATCQIPYGTAIGAPAATATCTLNIPEAQLHFSHLRFTWGTGDTTKCKVVFFQPYWYKASGAAGFMPEWFTPDQTPIDCSVNPIPADCYGGAGRAISSGTPPAVIVMTPSADSPVTTMTREIDSANSMHFHAYDYSNSTKGSNRWTVNDLPAGAKRTASYAGYYVANTFHDYIVTCTDEFYEPVYTINLNITSDRGSTDQLDTWDIF